jgi:hypothetical protein
MSAEPEDPANFETYGGQPPEHPDEQAAFAPEVLPNSPIPNVIAIPGIDEDPAPASSGSGLPSVIAVTEILATASDMPDVIPASISVAPLVAAPVTLVAATTAAYVLVEPLSEFERGRLAGIAAATAAVRPVSPQPSLVARVTSLPLASPPVPVPVRTARGLFAPLLGSAHEAIRPRVHGLPVQVPLFSEIQTHTNLLDPEFEPIHVSIVPVAANLSAGALSGPCGVWSTAPVIGPQRQTVRPVPTSEGWAGRPTTRQGHPPNPGSWVD